METSLHPDEEKLYGGKKSNSTTLFIIAAVIIALIIGWAVNGSGFITNKQVTSNTNTNQAKNSNSTVVTQAGTWYNVLLPEVSLSGSLLTLWRCSERPFAKSFHNKGSSICLQI